MDSTNKGNKWELFKEGAFAPLTLSMASLCFIFFIMLGAGVASYSFFSGGSWGLGIMFLGISLLQTIGIITEWKKFKFLKQQEKDIEKNKEAVTDLLKKLKEAEKE